MQTSGTPQAPILGVEPLLTKAGLVRLGPDSIADPGSATLSLNLDSGEVRAVELTVQVPPDALWGSITLSRSLTCNVMAEPVAIMLPVRTRGSARPRPSAAVSSPSSGR
jgi:hypothetical protein